MAFDFPEDIQDSLYNMSDHPFSNIARYVGMRGYAQIGREERYLMFRSHWIVFDPKMRALDLLRKLMRDAVLQVNFGEYPPFSRLLDEALSRLSAPAVHHGTLDLRGMPPAAVGFKVAFSFAGEQRDLVQSIAKACEDRLGRGTVFYDEWFQHVLAGYGADMFLQNIYGKQTQMVVLCVAKEYALKPWTMVEHEAIMARIMDLRVSANPRDRLRYLPIRVGEGEVPGVLRNTIIVDARAPVRSPEEIAELIVQRLAEIDA